MIFFGFYICGLNALWARLSFQWAELSLYLWAIGDRDKYKQYGGIQGGPANVTNSQVFIARFLPNTNYRPSSLEIVECKFLLLLRLQRFLILSSFSISGVNLGIPKASFGWKMGGNGNKHQKEKYITWCGGNRRVKLLSLM